MAKENDLFSTDDDLKFDKKRTLSVDLGKLSEGMSSQDKKEVATKAIDKEYRISVLLVISGLVCIGLGFALILLGVNNVLNFEINANVLVAKFMDATPGIVFLVIGAIVLFKSKVKIKG